MSCVSDFIIEQEKTEVIRFENNIKLCSITVIVSYALFLMRMNFSVEKYRISYFSVVSFACC